MAPLLIASLLFCIDFCFQSWYQRWCSDFLMVYLIRSVLYTDSWTAGQKFHIIGIVVLSAVQDFFIYGTFGFRLLWVIPFLVGVWSLAQLFRYRLFILSSLLVVGMIMLQEAFALFFFGVHETWYERGIRLIYSLIFMLFNDVIHCMKTSRIKKP